MLAIGNCHLIKCMTRNAMFLLLLKLHVDFCSLLGKGPMDWNDITQCYKIAQGAISIRKTVLPGMAIPMLKIRRPNGRLIFNMENAIRR